jgi:hypothetical protein
LLRYFIMIITKSNPTPPGFRRLKHHNGYAEERSGEQKDPLMKSYIFAVAIACSSLSCLSAQAAPISPDAATVQNQVTGSAIQVWHCRWWSGECGGGYRDDDRDYHSRYWSHRRRGSDGDYHSRYWSHRRWGSDNDYHSRYWSHRRRGSYWR